MGRDGDLGASYRRRKIELLKRKIRDEAYMRSAIDKIAAELTVFLSR